MIVLNMYEVKFPLIIFYTYSRSIKFQMISWILHHISIQNWYHMICLLNSVSSGVLLKYRKNTEKTAEMQLKLGHIKQSRVEYDFFFGTISASFCCTWMIYILKVQFKKGVEINASDLIRKFTMPN